MHECFDIIQVSPMLVRYGLQVVLYCVSAISHKDFCTDMLLFLLVGSALDLNFSDINVASLDKELEDQDNNGLGLTSKILSMLLLSGLF